MAEGRLTSDQRVKLAAEIPAMTMVKIALAHFHLGDGVVKNIRYDNVGNAEAQSREMLTKYLNKNPDNQVQVNWKIQKWK